MLAGDDGERATSIAVTFPPPCVHPAFSRQPPQSAQRHFLPRRKPSAKVILHRRI